MERRVRILAVDDEPRAVELVKRVLRKTAEVETATSGASAWTLFEAGEFDLVISDQRMPGMTGVELLARVAEQAPATGRILLTGYADAVDTLEAINRAHVHAYLSKPCPPTQLSLAVGSVLDRIEMQREHARLAEPDGLAGGGADALGQLLDWSDRLRASLDASAGQAVPSEQVPMLAEAAERIADLAARLAGKS